METRLDQKGRHVRCGPSLHVRHMVRMSGLSLQSKLWQYYVAIARQLKSLPVILVGGSWYVINQNRVNEGVERLLSSSSVTCCCMEFVRSSNSLLRVVGCMDDPCGVTLENTVYRRTESHNSQRGDQGNVRWCLKASQNVEIKQERKEVFNLPHLKNQCRWISLNRRWK